MSIGYYQPTLPENHNTARYRHAKIIGERNDSTLLVCEEEPPQEITYLYPNVRVFNSSHYLRKICKIKKVINSVLSVDDILITGVGPKPTLAGLMTRPIWIADIFDHPIQFAANNDKLSIQAIAAYLQILALKKPDLAIISLHKDIPLGLGRSRVFIRNGAPTDSIDFNKKPNRTPIRGIVAGKTRLQEGMRQTLSILDRSQKQISLDVFGESFYDTKQYAESIGVSDSITFHGNVPHTKIVETLSNSHIGFCTLPKRRDWDYSYPIKLGEYLAAGVFPIGTPRQGMCELAGSVGCFTNSVTKAAKKIEWLSELSRKNYHSVVDSIRDRAEEIAWENEAQKFITAIDDQKSESQ